MNREDDERNGLDDLVNIINERIDEFVKNFVKNWEEEKERYSRYNYCTLCDLEFFVEDNIEKYWILWLDILGFSDLVMNKKYKLIYEMLSFLSNSHSEKYSHYFVESSIICSDTCINLLRGEKTNFVYVLENIAILQIIFIQTFHQFLRGSVVIDEVFFSFDLRSQQNFHKSSIFLFGPGIVKAAKFEKEVEVPVVGISPELVRPVIDAYLRCPEDYPAQEEENSILFFLFRDCPDCSNYRFIVKWLLNDLLKVFLPSGEIVSFLDFIREFKGGKIKNGLFFVDYLGYLLAKADIEDNEKKRFIDIYEGMVKALDGEKLENKKEFLKKYLDFYKS